MKGTTDTRKSKLPPPYLPDTLYGGLGYNDLAANPEAHVIVAVGPWSDFVELDRAEVLIGPEKKSVAVGLYFPTDTQQILLTVRCKDILEFGDGPLALAARVTGPFGGNVFESDDVSLYVKTSLPGGHDPDIRTPYVNEGLDRLSVAPDPIHEELEGIHVAIPVYANMAEGDKASVRWNRVMVPVPTVSAEDVGMPLTTAIPRDVALEGAGGDAEVRYQVYDRVANWSLWSPPVRVRVPPDLSNAPIAPWVLGTVDELGVAVDLKHLGTNDIRIRISNHTGMPGDKVTVVWSGLSATGREVHFETPARDVPESQNHIDVSVPNRQVVALAASTAAVSYKVIRNDGNLVKSRVRRVNILGDAVSLPAPTVVEARDGTLDPGLVNGMAHVIVPAWAGIDAEDRCFLEWEGTRSDGSATLFSAVLTGVDANAGEQLVFKVPASAVTQLAGGSVRVRYAVSFDALAWRKGELRSEPIVHIESPWLTLKVLETVPPLSINSSPVELSTPIFRLQKPVITPPDGAYVTRVATGGIPPYLYSTADGAVEVDERTGRAVSLRNGKAVVVVTDARGATASYQVTVSKVCHLVDFGSEQFFQHAAGLAQQGGGHLPWGTEWDAMRAAYAGNPGVEPAAAWCSDGAGNKLQYCVYPNTGAREVRRSYPGVRSEDDDDPARWIPIGKPMQAARAWMVVAVNA